jgi:hypothetical protein
MTRALLAAAVLLAAAGCASRTATARSAAPKQEARGEERVPAVKVTSAEKSDYVVCRIERPTGSNIAKRVCYKAAELERASREAQRSLREPVQTVRRRTAAGSGPPR